MIYLQLLCLQLIVVFIVDLSGVVDSVKRSIWRFTKGKTAAFCDFSLKPFDCSLCMTFWSTLAFAAFAKAFTLPVLLYCCVLAFLTPLAAGAMNIVRDVLTVLLNKLSNLIDR